MWLPLQLRKQFPCQLNGTCCEKYCGCAKSCQNRFRGCHCATRQCCSGRECDPDVCRNCWRGCGDGKLVYPQQPEEKEHYTCHNMKLLLKQQQRVLLSKSDVAGWGAFLRNTVNKHEYLGEYTGELISHREADKRGKIYDRENSSSWWLVTQFPLFWSHYNSVDFLWTFKKKDDDKELEYSKKSCSLEDSLSVRWDSLPKRASKLFFATRIVEEFEQKVDGQPGQLTSRDVPALIAQGTELLQEQVLSWKTMVPAIESLFKKIAEAGSFELSPVCAILGGVLGQEVLKLLSCKGEPIQNFFFFDASDGKGMVEEVTP
ncbi:hypothetical protein R1sor_010902 [Riccia sorocarpa]|uniref:CXC domain-containing protein n=1 Tax=Riccia sorocarpa TaxID=122646 RepID=A0ABD3I0S7_9MARC